MREGHAGTLTLRAFRNAAGSLRGDEREGCDSWAVAQGWVSVTPVSLRSDMPLTAAEAAQRLEPRVMQALAAAMQAAAADLGVATHSIPPELAAAVEHAAVASV